jgi:tRNA threonylcarbamoyladenosine biosynthesis protein TsaE
METEEELEEIGFYEYLEEPEGIVVIEWPDKFPQSMPDDYVEVSIERISETGRKLTFSSIGEENKEFLKELETFVHTGH